LTKSKKYHLNNLFIFEGAKQVIFNFTQLYPIIDFFKICFAKNYHILALTANCRLNGWGLVEMVRNVFFEK